MLINISVSAFAVLCGLLAKTPETAGGLMFPIFILPFVSSGFAPVETMSGGLKWFAEVQPMSHMIDCMRAYMMGTPMGDSLGLTLIWCGGIIIVSFVASMLLYKRRLSD